MSSQTVIRRLQVIIDESGASKTLDRLKVKEQELIDKIKKGEQAGRDMTAELNRLSTVQQQVHQLEGVISGQLTPSLRQTRSAVQNLRRELDGMSADTPGYAQRLSAFRDASAQLGEMQRRVTGFRGAAISAFSEVKKIALGVTIGGAVQAIAQGISGLINGAISGAAKLSDAIADIEKATGLTTKQAEKLNGELSKINTRTSNSDLRDIAVSLGQAGVSATADNVAAIDQINVALGDEFGGNAQEIGNTLSVLRNNLADIKSENFGDDVSKIGNALNELGANGLATAPVVSDIANRIAGVAQTFGVSSGQILGTAAAFQELGINTERGSTAYTKLLQKMATDTKGFAKVAGMDIAEFTTLLNTDINEALLRVAKGTKEASQTNVAFAATLSELEAEGAGVSELLSKLATNGDLVRSKINLATTALTNNSSILSEFEKKNNTFGAQLDKLGKKMAGWFNSSIIRQFSTDVVTSLNEVSERGNKAAREFEKQKEKIEQLDKSINPLLTRYDELKAKTNLNATEQNELRQIINDIVDIIPEAISGFDEYGNVMDINRDKVGNFISTNKQFLRELEASAVESLQDDLQTTLGTIKSLQTAINVNNSAIEKGQASDYYRQLNVSYLQKLRENQKSLIENAEILEKKYGVDLPASISTAIDALRQQLNILPTTDLIDAKQFDIPNPNAKKTPIILPEEKKGKSKKSDADRERERQARDLEAFLKELARMEREAYKNSVDEYHQALLDISFKYDDVIKKSESLVFKSGSQKLAVQKKLLESFVTELQSVNKKFQEKPPEIPKDLNAPNQRKIDIDREVAAIAATNRKNERLYKVELDFIRATGRDKLKAELALLEEQFMQEIAASKYGENEILLIKAKYAKKKEEITKKSIEDNANEVAKFLDAGLEMVSAAAAVNDLFNQQDQQRLDAIRARHTKEQEGFQNMLDQKFLTQAQYDRKVNASNKRLAAEEKKIAKQQFDRNKAISLAQAVIATALAVTKSIPNVYQMALSAALGAVQIATIATQKAPQYAKGGFIPQGSSHAENGIGLRDNRTGKYVGTIEGGEPILSKGVYAANRPLVDALLAKGYHQDFTPITPKWMTAPPKTLNIPLISKSVAAKRTYFADGGITHSPENNGSNELNAQFLYKLLQKLDEPFVGVVSLNDLNTKAKTQASIRDAATIH